MATDDIKIKLAPYLGCSENLIELFAVIGYEEESIKQNIRNLEETKNKLELTFLSIIISDISHEIEGDMLIKRVYPEKPEILKTKNYPKTDRIVFSSCFDDNNGGKTFYSCFALRFYEKITTTNDEIYFIPKALLIYSQYPYFSSFYRICQKVILSTGDEFADRDFPIDVYIHCLVNYFPSPINNNIILKDFNPNIIIPKLTGYPYADFNLGKILNSINLIDFIKVYILIFLELDLLFFSPNLEKLNIFMFALYILNYPLTDSSYFRNIRTIMLESIDEPENYEPNTSFKGINCAFTQDIEYGDLKDCNFVIDIENQKIPIVKIKEEKDTKKINLILKYISAILNRSLFYNKSFFFEKYLLILHKKLVNILKEYNNITQKNQNFVDSFFYMDKSIMNINRQIQEVFYDFVLNILVELNKDFIFDPSLNNPIVKNINENPKYSDEENMFLLFLRRTDKYNLYFNNFINTFNVYEGIKVSLLFSDEYVNLKKQEKSKTALDKVKYFDVMDRLYGRKKDSFLIYDSKKIDREYAQKNYVPNNSIFQKEIKLFTFDRDIIKKFIYKKRNKVDYDVLKDLEKIHVDEDNKNTICITIRNYFSAKGILDANFYKRGAILYIIAVCFAFFPKRKLISVIDEYLNETKKIIYFQRHFIFILLKSINWYYKLNKEKGAFPEMKFENIQKYYEIIQEHLKMNSIIQDEEIFKFFKKYYKCKEEDNNINEEQTGKNFVFKFDDSNFNNYTNEALNRGNKDITLNWRNKIIKFNKIMYEDISLLFQESDSYYEYYLSQGFDIKKFDVNNICEKSANLIKFIDLDKNEQNIINILYYLVQSLLSFQDQLTSFNQQNE